MLATLRSKWSSDPTVPRMAIVLLLMLVAAWWGVVLQSRAMSMPTAGDAMDSTMSSPVWDGVGFVAAWTVMMAAMMLPSLLPRILLYRTAAAEAAERGPAMAAGSWLLAAGYVAVWGVFGVPVDIGSRALAAVAGSDMPAAQAVPYAVAAVLVLAGMYQFTPFMRTCLARCRGGASALVTHWQPGLSGALRMGLAEGWFSVGCCWALMVVLVAVGSMGLPWVAALTVVVLGEKLLPRGAQLASGVGLLLILLGMAVVVHPDLVMSLQV